MESFSFLFKIILGFFCSIGMLLYIQIGILSPSTSSSAVSTSDAAFNFQLASLTAPVEKKKSLKIVEIHSYTEDFICTAPQSAGITENIRRLESMYNITTKQFFLKAKTDYITDDARKIIGLNVLKKIDDINPDYIIMTDDIAFQYVGVEASKKYKVLASGLNKPFSMYKKDFPDLKSENIIVVEETIQIEKVFSILEKARFQPDTWYILYDNDMVSYYMMKDYTRQFPSGSKVVLKKVSSIQELRSYLKLIQDNPAGVLVITLPSLEDPDKRKRVTKDEFFKEFTVFNKKHLELGGNPEFAKIGYSLCCGPDFQTMGRLLSQKFYDILIENKPFKHEVIIPSMEVSANSKRLKELEMSYITTSAFKLIDEIYNYY